jgi:hypothetical protein
MKPITVTTTKGVPVGVNPEWMMYWYPCTIEGQEHKGTQIIFGTAPDDKSFKVQEPADEINALIEALD